MPIATPSPETIAEAAAHLVAGKLVAFPTETVYGLGADATNPRAVANIFATKGRPQFNPLIVHVADLETASQHAIFSDLARKIAQHYWPGPLTLVLPRRHLADQENSFNGEREKSIIADLTTSGLDTIALRMPAHPVARALLAACNIPLAAPSANRSGHVSPTTAQHVATDFPEGLAMILDGGPCALGIESTILDCTRQQQEEGSNGGEDGNEIVLLRAGAITAEDLRTQLGANVLSTAQLHTTRPTAPGQLASHYAPRASLRLNTLQPNRGEAFITFAAGQPAHTGLDATHAEAPVYHLSPSGNLEEAAAHLFSALRTLDASGCDQIAVMPIPEKGLGIAINDRLARAAAPRKTGNGTN